jgi:hypothetical protein
VSALAMKAAAIVPKLTNADVRGMRSTPGAGNYSTACFLRLKHLGLVDNNFWPTELGWEVRIRVGGSSC